MAVIVPVSRSFLSTYIHLTANIPSLEIIHYNLTSDAWNEVGTMEIERSSHGVVAVDDVANFCGLF